MSATAPACLSMTVYACTFVVVVYALAARGIEAAAADELDIGCVDTQSARRCFTLHKTDATWTDATTGCGGMNDSRLAIIDSPDIEEKLNMALTPLEHDSSDDRGYIAWTAGLELDQQLEWNWLNGRPFQATEAEEIGMNVQLTSEATIYADCAAVTVSSQPETNLTITSHECRSSMSYLLCQTVNVSNEASCNISGKPGLLVGNSCYAVITSSDAQQQAGVSWFKALSHCASLGSNLASLDVNTDSLTSQLGDYLNSSGLQGQPLWIGLNRRPWVWVQSFDPASGEAVSTTPMLYNDWWEPEQPNRHRQNCMSVICGHGRCGWSDESCAKRMPYVCEHSEALTVTTQTTSLLNTTILPTSMSITTDALALGVTSYSFNETAPNITTVPSATAAAAAAASTPESTLASPIMSALSTGQSSLASMSTTSSSLLEGPGSSNVTETGSASATSFAVAWTGSTSTSAVGSPANTTTPEISSVSVTAETSSFTPSAGFTTSKANTLVTDSVAPSNRSSTNSMTTETSSISLVTSPAMAMTSSVSSSDTVFPTTPGIGSMITGNDSTSMQTTDFTTTSRSASTATLEKGSTSFGTDTTTPLLSIKNGSVTSEENYWTTAGMRVATVDYTNFIMIVAVCLLVCLAIVVIAIASVCYYKFSYKRRGYIKQR